MSFEKIDGGRVRSVREAKLAVHEIPCPKCGKGLTMLRGVKDADASGYTVHVRSRHCSTEYDLEFKPGPGWERRPPETGIEIAATDDPSTVIPESKFVWYFNQSMSNLAEIEPAPSDPDKRVVWEDMAKILARDAIGMALEVGTN